MNTAEQIQQSGSKSSNAMSKKEQTWLKVQAMRKAFAGPRYELLFTDEALGVQYFRAMVPGSERCAAMVFSGKKMKPVYHFTFSTVERAEAYQLAWYKHHQKKAEDKANERIERAAKAAQGHDLKVGDVLASSWGYEQTNVDYYQVVGLVGLQSVEVRPIDDIYTETGFMSGSTVPDYGNFTGDIVVKRVKDGCSIKVHSWGVYARKMTPLSVVDDVPTFQPMHCSSYA